MFNILFILRIDAKEKNGGDLFQAKQYQRVLQEQLPDMINIKYAHDITKNELETTTWDLVELFNVSRLDEHMFYLKSITYKNIIMTPVVQPGYLYNFKDYIKSFIRGLFKFKYLSYNTIEKKHALLSKCLFNVYLSHDEQLYYEKNFVKTPKSILVHNGIDKDLPSIEEKNNKEIDFLIVGRIEKSKNSLNTLELLNTHFPHLKTQFIGAGNKYHFRYFKKFLQKCAENENISYLGVKTHSEVLALMSNAKVLLNLSLKEVSPLVDLEALACHMKVLSTTESFTHLKESSCFMRVNPSHQTEIIEKINLINKSHCESKKEIQVFSWEMTLKAYTEEIKILIQKEK